VKCVSGGLEECELDIWRMGEEWVVVRWIGGVDAGTFELEMLE
jgi:hypothetical protein